MIIKEGFILRQICGEYIVVGEGLAQVNFNKMMSLNESAAYLWKEVQGKEFSVEDLTKLLLDRYEVAEDVARADAAKLAATWKEQGVAED